MSIMIHAVGDHGCAMFRVLSTMNLLEGYTINKEMHIEVLHCLRDAVTRNHLEELEMKQMASSV
jgi:hypothetical protein